MSDGEDFGMGKKNTNGDFEDFDMMGEENMNEDFGDMNGEFNFEEEGEDFIGDGKKRKGKANAKNGRVKKQPAKKKTGKVGRPRKAMLNMEDLEDMPEEAGSDMDLANLI